MSVEKILVDDFTFTLTKDGWIISLEMGKDVVKDAFLSYDGRNCAVLTVNGEKAYLLTNIAPNVREDLKVADSVIVLHLEKGEVANGYKVDIRHVAEVPYPDTFVEDMAKALEDVRQQIGDEKYEELIDNLVEQTMNMFDNIGRIKK
jgi:hypothetical protein